MHRTIEVFTDSQLFSNDLENKVRELACPRCTIHVYDASNNEDNLEMEGKLAEYGITSLPAVVFDCKPVPLDKLYKDEIVNLVRQLNNS